MQIPFPWERQWGEEKGKTELLKSAPKNFQDACPRDLAGVRILCLKT